MNVVVLPVQHRSLTQRLVVREKEVVGSQYAVPSRGELSGVRSPASEIHTVQPQASSPQPPALLLVGRDAELTQLHRSLDKALHGERQIVFVTGEPGIGKTTLVDAFLARLRDRVDVHLTSGQCVELYGPGEAYLPLLEATTRLCRGPDREQRVESLKRYAPSWLVQLPGLLDPEDHALLQQRVQGASREHMLREMAEAVEMFTQQRGLVVVLEDLHWSDVSTLEWLSYVTRRREPAKLLLIGTYRPTDVLNSGHPLRGVMQELTARHRCSEIHVTPLSEQLVSEYLTSRFHRAVADSTLPGLIHRRTAGNPLFVVNVVDDLCQQGIVHEEAGQWRVHGDQFNVIESVPNTLRHVIERQVERLSIAARQLLEVASIVGVEFSAAAVAAGLQVTVEEVDQQCELLAHRGQFIHAQGVEEWPDNTLSERYSFRHALYQGVLAERVGETQKVRVHRRVGERKALAYGERVGEIAAELAVHFEKGRDLTRAIHYLSKAGETAAQRSAPREAIVHFMRGLELLATFPDTPERRKQELTLQVALGVPLLRTKGYAAPEVAHAFGRARELCQQIGEQPELFRALIGLSSFYVVRAELQTARELAEQCLRLAQHAQDPALLMVADFNLGATLLYSGELTSAQAILDQGSAIYDPQAHGSLMLRYGQDPGVACRAYASLTKWLLGYPDQALGKSHDALSLARKLSHSFSIGAALHTAAWLHQYRQDGHAVQAYTEEEIALAKEGGFALWLAAGTMLRGWALSEQGAREEGLAQMREGMAALNATGTVIAQPYQLALVAQAYGKSGQAHEGLALLDQALTAADKTGERYYEAELYRLRGELTLAGAKGWGLGAGEEENQKPKGKRQKSENPEPQSQILDPAAEAEECFLKSLDIARQQQAKSLELRAATSLARLWHSQGKLGKAWAQLEEVYAWFSEGFDTKDLQEAEALLVTLGGNVSRKEEKQKSQQAEGLRPKAEGPSSFSPYSLQPTAYSLAQSPSCPIPNSQPLTPNVFRHEGDYWTLAYDGKVCGVRDMRGLHYLAYLLQHPNDDIHAFRLVTGDETKADARHSAAQPSVAAEARSFSASDSGEILDAHARAAYKQRIADVQAELDEAVSFHDQGRIDRLREELDFLTHELAQAVGLGGRARRVGSPVERARTTVTKAIKNALKKIREHHVPLGQYLTRTIKTGTFCVYALDPRSSVSWQF